jgi:hypothetical protein
MATTPRTDRPPPIDPSGNVAGQSSATGQSARRLSPNTPANAQDQRPMGWRDRREERLAQQEKQNKAVVDAQYRRATQGIPDQETRDRVLALGGDVTRGSPVSEQSLPEPEPGLTTTTGAPSTPIDPTTAAVPAGEYDPIVRRMRGVPTVGGRKGQGEELFKKPKYSPEEIPEEAEPITAPEDDEVL